MVLNCGICGLGRIGNLHYKNIKNNVLFSIKFLIDSDIYKINEYDEPLFEPYTLETLLENDNIDCLFIFSPTKHHYNTIMLALKYNCHVFVEKPASNKIEEIEKMYTLANEKQLVLMVGFNRRYDPNIIDLKKKYNDLKTNIEQVLVISRDYPYPSKNFINISGGIYHDCVIHDIDSICWILGKFPLAVYSSGSITSDIGNDTGHLDNVSTIMEFSNGIIVNIISSRISDSYDQRIEFMSNGESLIIKNSNNKPISFPERYKLSYKNEIIQFYNHIKNKTKPSVSMNDCINSHIIAEACEQSFNEGKKIYI